MRIAILSPSENKYSETFIQAHRKYLKGEIFYYSGGASSEQMIMVKILIQGGTRSFLNFIQE